MRKRNTSSPESAEREGPERRDDSDSPELSSYERQRLRRIEENNERMEALGLQKTADCFRKSRGMKKKIDAKNKISDEEEEYNPTPEEDDEPSSSGDDVRDDEFSPSHTKNMKKSSSRSRSNKSRPEKRLKFHPNFENDDQVLKKKNSATESPSDSRRKRSVKQMKNNRVQINEDELLIHFFQFDETGKGGITARDVRRLAKSQDFTWSEEEISDMITFFDHDGDGKLTLEEFCKIVIRCDMLVKGSE